MGGDDFPAGTQVIPAQGFRTGPNGTTPGSEEVTSTGVVLATTPETTDAATLVPVRWSLLDGSTRDHWEDPSHLAVLIHGDLAKAVLGWDFQNVRAIRIKLGSERPAPQPDPLGRATIGFRDRLSTAELWERGRGVWKMRANKVVAADLILLAHDGIVRLVGTVDGIGIHGDRLSVTGRPIPDHPSIGNADPLDNDSQNPVAYGHVKIGPADYPHPATEKVDPGREEPT